MKSQLEAIEKQLEYYEELSVLENCDFDNGLVLERLNIWLKFFLDLANDRDEL